MEAKQKIFVTIGTVAIVAAASIGGLSLFKSPQTSSAQSTTSSQTALSSPSTSSTTPSTTASGSSTAATGTYKDGTYTNTVNYNVPHGASNSIAVTLVVSGGNISSVKTNNNYSDGQSSYYISSFESSVSSDASGQSLANYSPSQVGGASLTTYAFSNAIDNIRSQATA
jgi:major membrane immunogen (membrane-anchored lipoprotein)